VKKVEGGKKKMRYNAREIMIDSFERRYHILPTSKIKVDYRYHLLDQFIADIMLQTIKNMTDQEFYFYMRKPSAIRWKVPSTNWILSSPSLLWLVDGKVDPAIYLKLKKIWAGKKDIEERICDNLLLIGFGGAISNFMYFFKEFHNFKTKPFKKIYVFEKEYLDFTNLCRYFYFPNMKTVSKLYNAYHLLKDLADEVILIPTYFSKDVYRYVDLEFIKHSDYLALTSASPSGRLEISKILDPKRIWFIGHFNDEAVLENQHNEKGLMLAFETYGKIKIDVLKANLSALAYYFIDIYQNGRDSFFTKTLSIKPMNDILTEDTNWYKY